VKSELLERMAAAEVAYSGYVCHPSNPTTGRPWRVISAFGKATEDRGYER